MKENLGNQPQDVVVRFWNKVRIPDNYIVECWTWTAARDYQGYGRFRIGGMKGYTVRANRFAYEYYNGPIPYAMHVLHYCDNPPCCSPYHLFLGDPKRNSDDRVAKDRGWKKISDDVLIEIFDKILNKKIRSVSELQRQYNVSRGWFYSLVNGGWRSDFISSNYDIDLIKKLMSEELNLKERNKNILKDYNSGLSRMQLEIKYGLSSRLIRRILSG